MAFPLDPATLSARNYIPFFRHGGLLQSAFLKFDTPVTGIQIQHDVSADSVTGLVSGEVLSLTVQSSQGMVAGDITEINGAGQVRTATLSSSTAIGVAVTGGTTTARIRVNGLVNLSPATNSASLIAGQYAIMSSESNRIAGTTSPTYAIGRILTSSASTGGISTVLLRN